MMDLTRHAVRLARRQLEGALRALPKHPQAPQLALLIEEAIEMAYELELSRHESATEVRPKVVALQDAQLSAQNQSRR